MAGRVHEDHGAVTDGSYLRLEQIRKAFGNFIAVDKLNLTLDKGQCLVLLGPSGCGKTTTLNIVAGFAAPDSGKILLDGRDITHVPPHKRDFGMVFQDYALFPHMTILDNVMFGLRMRRIATAERQRKAEEALELVGLPGLSNRYPAQLSGGQRQRVALARSIVIRPTLLLFDEPLSNLDARLREGMRGEIRKLLDATKITALFVTHDQSEAFAIADRVALLNAGSLVQFGLPHELYERPNSAFAATFLGGCNLIPAEVTSADADQLSVTVEGTPVRITGRDWRPDGSKLILVVRPQHLRVSDDGPISGTVTGIEYLGSQTKISVRSRGDLELVAESPGRAHGYQLGQTVSVSWDSEKLWFLPEGDHGK